MICDGVTPLLYSIPSYPESAEIQWEDWKHQAARSFLCNFYAKKLGLGKVKADCWGEWRMQGEVRHCSQILYNLVMENWVCFLVQNLRRNLRDFGYLHFVSVVSVSCAWKISSSFSVLQAKAAWGSSILLQKKMTLFLSSKECGRALLMCMFTTDPEDINLFWWAVGKAELG